MKINSFEIKKIISNIDIEKVFSLIYPIIKQGNNYFCKCPYHLENSPSLCIFNNKRFYCFGCKKSGDIIDLLMFIEGKSFVEIINKLSKNVIIDKCFIEKQDIYKKDNNILLFNNLIAKLSFNKLIKNNNILLYLKSRSISNFIIKYFNIGYYEHIYILNIFKQNKLDFNFLKKMFIFNKRIIFPIRDINGLIVGFGGRSLNCVYPRYVNSKEDFFFKKKKLLYGYFELCKFNKFYENIIIVEGFMDVLSLFSNNITNVVALLGTNFSLYHFNLLKILSNNFYFCFDGDITGYLAYLKLLDVILPIISNKINFFFIILPLGLDPSDIVKKNKYFFLNIINNFKYCLSCLILKFMYKYLKINNFLKEIKFYKYFIKKINLLKKNSYKFLILYNLKKKMIFLKYKFINNSHFYYSNNTINRMFGCLIYFLLCNKLNFININILNIYYNIRNLNFIRLFLKLYLLNKLNIKNQYKYLLFRKDFFYQIKLCIIYQKFIKINFINLIKFFTKKIYK